MWFLQSCCPRLAPRDSVQRSSVPDADGACAVSAGMETAAMFAGSLPGLLLISLGQTMVVACLCFDMVRAMSVPSSHRRYVASTVFRTLAVPSIFVMAFSVLVDVILGSWLDLVLAVFVMVAIIFRFHQDKDEDNWWKGKGRKLAGWARRQLAPLGGVAPAMG